MNTSWKRPRKRTFRGLGDAVHLLAQPIAKAIDAVAGTRIQECQACAKRREDWNNRFPLGGPVDSSPGA